MTTNDIRTKFIEYFKARGHTQIPSAPLVPENDPTTLFTSSGMQPLIPYLLGAIHPSGKRLVDSQKSFRAQDIEEVGDNRHTTFFEMLGNWSFGDYFKQEQLPWIFEFLTKEVKLDKKRLFISVFQGDGSVPKDTESRDIWKSLGVSDDHIFFYGVKKNWWSRSGEPEKMPAGELGGPDSEVFFDFGTPHDSSFGEICHPNCDCGRFMEIANSVFMQYKKLEDGSLVELKQKNVDFGGGLERLAAAVNDNKDMFTIDLFKPLIEVLSRMSGKDYNSAPEVTRSMRVIADHIRASVMLMADGVLPSNKGQGYVLRRLIRRALLYGRNLGLVNDLSYIQKLVSPIVLLYENAYPEVRTHAKEIEDGLMEEAIRFIKTLDKGLLELGKIPVLDGKIAFSVYETYGFPWELTEEIAIKRGQTVDRAQFEKEFKKHKDLSRTATTGMFKGGLADRSEQTTKLHTAHHLFLRAVQQLVDPSIKQRGSNITPERMRIDFNFARKLTDEELRKIETMVNDIIKKNLPVTREEMKKEEAQQIGAQMEFGHKYPDLVSVYFVGPKDHYFSAEFCGGPHVSFTGLLGHFTIVKEESAGAGIRRVYGKLI